MYSCEAGYTLQDPRISSLFCQQVGPALQCCVLQCSLLQCSMLQCCVLRAAVLPAAVLCAVVLPAAVLCAAVLHVQATWKGEMPRCVAAEAETGRVWCEESADTACQQLCYLQGEGTHDTCRHVTRDT